MRRILSDGSFSTAERSLRPALLSKKGAGTTVANTAPGLSDLIAFQTKAIALSGLPKDTPPSTCRTRPFSSWLSVCHAVKGGFMRIRSGVPQEVSGTIESATRTSNETDLWFPVSSLTAFQRQNSVIAQETGELSIPFSVKSYPLIGIVSC